MTLKEQLEKESGCVYIGAGNAFFYIGSADCDDFLNELSEVTKKKIEKTIKRLKTRIENLEVRKSELRAEKKAASVEEKVGIRDKQKIVKQQIFESQKSLVKWKQELQNFKPICDRDVVEIYKRRFVRPLGKIIRIEKSFVESKSFWTLEEFEKRGVE